MVWRKPDSRHAIFTRARAARPPFIEGRSRQTVADDGLLDALKETALDTGFLDVFETSASREALDRKVRDQRLLLCLYGLGTNAGLKRVAAGVPATSYDELLHIRRRYIDAVSLRAATAKVADATLTVRNPVVWGDAGTACAADSTTFGAWIGI